jgi:Domain of unknown function (DUF4476)
MTRIIFAILFFLALLPGKMFCQKETYLVLIDEEQQLPFYVRMGGQTISSSSQGHLVITHLQDSTYELVIGFAQKGFAEQKFAVTVNHKDLGFRLRNLKEKGWALYNWQTKELTTPLASPNDSTRGLELGIKKDDAFSRLMASVVNDTLVMYTSYASQRLLDDTVGMAPQTTSSSAVPDTAKSTPGGRTDSAITPAPAVAVVLAEAKPEKKKAVIPKAEHPQIKKLVQRPSKIALRIVYLDISKDGIRDTITLLIPFDKDSVAAVAPTEKAVTPVAAPLANQANAPVTGKATPAVRTTGKKPFTFNPVCIDLASDYDIDVARVNIVTATTPPEKLSAARKAFSTMCFSVKQIRNLSELFSGDKAKLDFFKAVYPHTSDQDHFGRLVDTMDSPEGIKHFNTWLPK